MKPLRIDHANVFDDFKDVLIEMELTDKDKEDIWKFDGCTYDKSDVAMLVWVNVENDEANGINYVAYYPEDRGEYTYYTELMDDEVLDECIKFVTENYFGNEEKYDC